SDITMVYGVMLNWNPYNSIFNAFNLSVTNYLNRDYYKFSWDDVTQSYDVTDPDYLLVIGIDDNFSKYDCWHVSDNSTTMGKQTISEWLKNIYHWTSPSDVPNTVNLVARVEVKLDNGQDVAISNEKTFFHLPQFTFESSQPIHLWWLVGSFIGICPWDIYPDFGNNGLVPMYPVQGAIYNENGEGPLEYYGYFPAGGMFKIIETPGSWDNTMGGGDENGGQEYNNPNAIVINQGGYYKIDFNTVDKTMTMTRLSDSQTSYSTITMPGYYNNWDVTSNAMTALNSSNNHDWLTFLTLDNDSELKFTPGSWDYDWGTNKFPYGKGYQGGYNIPAKQGGYFVYFNDISGDYMFLDDDGLPGSNYLKITKYDIGDFIDLTWDYASGTTIKLCDISTDLEGPYQLHFDSKSITIDQDGKVDLNELKEAVFSTYDRPRTGGCALYCWVEAQSGPQTVKSNTISVPVQIENYSIVIDGSGTIIEMISSGFNTFKAIIPASSSDIRFRIAPESSNADIDMISPFGDGDVTATNGSIGFGMQSYFKIPYNASYREYEVEINLGYKTYYIDGHSKASMIWQAGVANNWGNPASGLSMNNDGTYTGYMFLNGDFKLKEDEDGWDGTNWGSETYQGSYMSGTLVESGYNLYAPQGFYKVDVDLNDLYYNLTSISSVSVIGEAVPTGTQWQTDLELTYNQSTGAWEGIYVLNSGDFKFRANHDWNLNWGGTLETLDFWGANLHVSQPGPYKIQVYLTYDGNSHATLTRQ
ncbi:MAG: hypothetical protein IKT03_03685, partial [Muribaculaceae bacterium]|nr:hypothetical protein [Muribaculaceae bacterium]